MDYQPPPFSSPESAADRPVGSTRRETVLVEARFDPKLTYYWMTGVQLLLLVTFVGIPFMPIWLLAGWGFHKRQLERLKATLTDRSLNIQRGVIFRVEKNIPLDKIQDLTMREGPLLRWLGLALLHVETAGQNVGGSGSAHLVGVIDAPKFRDAVLDQRERMVEGRGSSAAAAIGAHQRAAGDPTDAVLGEIRDTLKRIETALERIAGPN